MWCWTNGAIGGWGIFGIVMMSICWIVVIALAVWWIRRFSKGPAIASAGGVLDIAKQRYARGEISKEEYEDIKRDLS